MLYTLAMPSDLIYEKDNQIIISIISYIEDFIGKLREKHQLIKNRKNLYKTMDIVYANMNDLLNHIENISKSCENEDELEKAGYELIKHDDIFYDYLQEIYTNCYDANEIIKKIDTKNRTQDEQLTSVALTAFIFIFKLIINSINEIKFKDVINNA